ncbi:MAG: trehalose-phosphatase [Candidatus Omnitrophica bacterium]|nr:trehalose-phosphatase [Candidatus Omnitrophota bacterium]
MPAEGRNPIAFFENLDQIKDQIAGREVFLFLDYDGTLTPIVATPDLAIISDGMRRTVIQAAQKATVSIVSGRATGDVRGKVKIDGIFYAGSHGFEIVDPNGEVTINEEAQRIRSTIDEVHGKLSERLKKVEGALVENVKYTISSHYRLVSEEDFPKVEGAVDAILEEYPSLRKTSGKKVFEIRPRIDWDKGKAVNWIMDYLQFDKGKHFPIYIGDDTTDEDAFRVLKDNGFGILVAEHVRASEAAYMIQNTDEVKTVLEYFIEQSQKDML